MIDAESLKNPKQNPFITQTQPKLKMCQRHLNSLRSDNPQQPLRRRKHKLTDKRVAILYWRVFTSASQAAKYIITKWHRHVTLTSGTGALSKEGNELCGRLQWTRYPYPASGRDENNAERSLMILTPNPSAALEEYEDCTKIMAPESPGWDPPMNTS